MKLPKTAESSFVRGLASAMILVLGGCGSSIERHTITGKVTYDGQPVEYGTIFFAPDTAKGGTGPQGSAEIRQGRYQTELDKGPVSGPQVVRISGWNSSPESGILGAPTFSDHIVQVEVTGAAQLDFDVPAKPAARK